MTVPRYSREDMADQVAHLTVAANRGQGGTDGFGQVALVSVTMLRVAAAMLSEAANRAPSHRTLVEMIEREGTSGDAGRG